jgi:hypothetical protein
MVNVAGGVGCGCGAGSPPPPPPPQAATTAEQTMRLTSRKVNSDFIGVDP